MLGNQFFDWSLPYCSNTKLILSDLGLYPVFEKLPCECLLGYQHKAF